MMNNPYPTIAELLAMSSTQRYGWRCVLAEIELDQCLAKNERDYASELLEVIRKLETPQ